ncbi:dTDP-4-dehydrorhamnose reductase [Belliella buryatensis]|uniref:dTDP-4-dehydrorhamnose reductase n=1 Tax=Belliella buryatensis TaxID=1500549 RepID=A0A239BBN5_9BACT|nr:SDR family oxidoreductase [Belliella buryatensis]SNS05415.1 dTDP-4-dehydrorhamnose reductase [Belliella buryatensis]
MNKLQKAKILITGANGLLGQKLVQLILQEGEYQLLPSGLGESRFPDGWNVENWITMDIRDPQQVWNVFDQHQPDYLIHTAAMTNVDQCEKELEACKDLNINAVRNIVAACEKYNTHMIHLSTDFIFDGAAGPYDEDAVPNPVNFYGWTKLEAERIIAKSKIKAAIVRTVLVYGIANDMSRSNIILWVKESLEKGKKIQVVNDQFRTPTLAEDLAKGCYQIIKKNAIGIFNISGKDLLTPYAMAIATADYFKLNKDLIKETNSQHFKQIAQRPMKTGFIISKAIQELDFMPKSFMDGIGILSKQLKLADS